VAAPSGGWALEARDLRRRFGDVAALAGLSFAVRPGELYGLVGPDGAGKTTAIRALAGLLDLDAGEARVRGLDPLRGGRAVREALGLMPQAFSLYRDLTVMENLRFFGLVYCLSRSAFRERTGRLLALTRLGPFGDRRADALSGGMYKKLALACALLHQPEVLVLDEPTNGVDPVSRRELWALLHEFVHGGMAVLVSTPYMDEAERCDRVGLIHRGGLLLEGGPRELIQRSGTRNFEELFLSRIQAAEAA
jgi:ABC-2 type transport system ATP-binding protein